VTSFSPGVEQAHEPGKALYLVVRNVRLRERGLHG
jgi:hypothetical protein